MDKIVGIDLKVELLRAFDKGAQSRQAEVNFLNAQLGIKRDQIKGFEGEIKKAWQAVEEKDKRIEEALDLMVDGHYELAEQVLRGDDA